jgi:uncharacterized SAM-binding protein YcdF (DUF218 family)
MLPILANFLVPSGIAYVLFAAGLIARLMPRLQRYSWPLLALGAGITLVFSTGIVASALNSPLEYSHPTLHDARAQPDVRHIVVLTGWAGDDKDMPLSGRMNPASAYRVLMGLELHRQRPDLDIVVSGSAESARIMGEVFVALGVPANQVRVEANSDSTALSAKHLRNFVGDDPFLLVTSAGHLPRTLDVMHARGLAPVPAPTHHLLPRRWWNAEFTPHPSLLDVSDLATHEYLARVATRVLHD